MAIEFAACPRCGIRGIHACPGSPLPSPTPEKKQELVDVMRDIFKPTLPPAMKPLLDNDKIDRTASRHALKRPKGGDCWLKEGGEFQLFVFKCYTDTLVVSTKLWEESLILVELQDIREITYEEFYEIILGKDYSREQLQDFLKGKDTQIVLRSNVRKDLLKNTVERWISDGAGRYYSIYMRNYDQNMLSTDASTEVCEIVIHGFRQVSGERRKIVWKPKDGAAFNFEQARALLENAGAGLLYIVEVS